MTENEVAPEAQERIVQAITSFVLYDFPESHAASFALIAYASAYLKVLLPGCFYHLHAEPSADGVVVHQTTRSLSSGSV